MLYICIFICKAVTKELLKPLPFLYLIYRISDVLSPLKLTIQDVYTEYKEIIATFRYMQIFIIRPKKKIPTDPNF